MDSDAFQRHDKSASFARCKKYDVSFVNIVVTPPMRRSSSTTVPPLNTTRSNILSSASASSSNSSDEKSHAKGKAEDESLPNDSVVLASGSNPTNATQECTEKSTSKEEEEEYQVTMRERMRLRLQDSRTAAANEWKEFRAHPAQSAKEGAKTVSGMLRKYGPVFIGTYGCVYFTTLGLLFSGVQSGLLDPLVLFSWLGASSDAGGDAETAKSTVHLVVEWMEHHDITKPYAPTIEKHPAFANLAVAWIAVKFTEPVRLAVALTLTPRVSRFLGYTKETETDDAASDDKASDAGKSGNPTAPPQ
jgi:Protein of unknown function (DUF1279)